MKEFEEKMWRVEGKLDCVNDYIPVTNWHSDYAWVQEVMQSVHQSGSFKSVKLVSKRSLVRDCIVFMQ